MDMKTGTHGKLSINSDSVDSYHSWGSKGRWFCFSSKRGTRLFARPYFCHVDEAGNVSKPVLLPQKDPKFYTRHLRNFNVPELRNWNPCLEIELQCHAQAPLRRPER